jgi:hypothetical protein
VGLRPGPKPREIEVRECAFIIETLEQAGVSVRLEGSRLIVEGDAVASNVEASVATLSGREAAVQAALGCGADFRTLAEERHERARVGREGGRMAGPRNVCLRGHPFDAENTLKRADGARRCRACNRLSRRKCRTS